MNFYKEVLKLEYITAINPVNDNTIKVAFSLEKTNRLRDYLWRNLINKDWLTVANLDEFVNIISLNSSSDNELYQTQIFISDFLYKIADLKPKEVIKIIKSAHSNNSRVIWNFAEIGIKIPPNFTVQLISKVKEWNTVEYITSTNYAPDILKWFNHLLKGNKYNASLKLLSILTKAKDLVPLWKEDPEREELLGEVRPKAIPIFDSYYTKILLTAVIEQLTKERPFEVANILTKALENNIKIEYGRDKGGNDFSYIWRPAIEDHQQNYGNHEFNEVLLVALRTALEIFVSINPQQGINVIHNFFVHKYSIFRRLAIHLLRLNFEKYKYYVEELIENQNLLHEIDISHEYYILLQENFTSLSNKTQKYIIDSILSFESFDSTKSLEIQEKQKKSYWFERLHFFEKNLENKGKEFYELLKQEFPGEVIHDTAAWTESYYGEASPLSISKVEAMNIKEIWQYIKDFKPINQRFNSPSHDGLARIFGEAISNSPSKYLNEDLTPLIDFPPNYSYWVLNTITNIFKRENLLENIQYVNNILLVCSRLMRLQNIPGRFTNDMGINFSSVRKNILDILQALIKTHQKIFPLEYKDQIWEIIEYLCYCETDSLESLEKSDSGMDVVTMSLNTFKGTAMHTLIDYALWYAYHTKPNHLNKINPNRLEGEERVKILLNNKLDKNNDPSLTVHSVFGLFLPNLAYLDISWLKENLVQIFPVDNENEEYWKAAWGAYIGYSKFYTDLFKLLRPQFEKAIEYIVCRESTRFSNSSYLPTEAMGQHLIIACLSDLDNINKTDSLTRKYIQFSKTKNMANIVQYISNLIKTDNMLNRESFWDQAISLWKIRIKVAKRVIKEMDKQSEEEYGWEFAKYIDWLSILPANVTLKKIAPLLKETININRKGWRLPDLIKYLALQSEQYPIEAIKLFEQSMKTDAPHHFYYEIEEEIITILKNAIRISEESRKKAESIISKFGEWGNYTYKEFWQENFLPSFIVGNTTINDVYYHTIRILSNYKEYFPGRKVEIPTTYKLKVEFDKHIFDVDYKIGSWDGEKRSGRLVFEKADYIKMNLAAEDKIKVIILIKNKFYKIIKL